MCWKSLYHTLCIMLLLCMPTVACSNMSYVSNQQLEDHYSTSFAQLTSAATKKSKHYGAIRLKSYSDYEEGVNSDRIFLLIRYDRKYMAETLLFDHSNNTKANFEKSFISFGADNKNRSISLRLRFIY